MLLRPGSTGKDDNDSDSIDVLARRETGSSLIRPSMEFLPFFLFLLFVLLNIARIVDLALGDAAFSAPFTKLLLEASDPTMAFEGFVGCVFSIDRSAVSFGFRLLILNTIVSKSPWL